MLASERLRRLGHPCAEGVLRQAGSADSGDPMIYVGELYLGSDVWQEPVQRAIGRIRQALGGGTEDGRASLDLVFHVPGPILGPVVAPSSCPFSPH